MAYAIDIKLQNNRYFTEPCVNCGKYIRYYKDDTDIKINENGCKYINCPNCGCPIMITLGDTMLL